MTDIITDPEVLQEYKDDANYYYEMNPDQPQQRSKIATFLGKASGKIEAAVAKGQEIATGPSAKKVDSFLRDMAAKTNAHGGLGGGEGGFDFRNMGGGGDDGGFDIRNVARPSGRSSEREPCRSRGKGSGKTTVIKPNGDIVITQHAQGKGSRRRPAERDDDDGGGMLRNPMIKRGNDHL